MNWTDQEIVSGVIDEFLALSAAPHGSGNEGAIGDYLMKTLKELGGEPRRDGAGNITADLPAVAGMEGAPLTILQGHMDMVCAVAPDSGYDPLRDPVRVLVEDGCLKSDGRSSLGADNCLGVAALLFLLRRGAAHGPVRLLFTVEEELGLLGAKKVDPAWLDGGVYLINTDGFQGDQIVISSAGGWREKWSRPLALCPPKGRTARRVTLSGFTGGHSGFDIGRGRANPIRLLARLLTGTDWEVGALEGGHSFNAIPMGASALVCAPEERELEGKLRAWAKALGERCPEDPQASLEWAACPLPAAVWTAESRRSVLTFLSELQNGVWSMRTDLPDQVAASSNLGQCGTEGENFCVYSFIRSAEKGPEEAISAAHGALAQAWGFGEEAYGYPGWPGDVSNPLAQMMSALYQARNGRPMEITARHVGLEPSVFLEKNPGLLMVNVGPTILDPHSTTERAPLADLPPFVRLLGDTLVALNCAKASNMLF